MMIMIVRDAVYVVLQDNHSHQKPTTKGNSSSSQNSGMSLLDARFPCVVFNICLFVLFSQEFL